MDCPVIQRGQERGIAAMPSAEGSTLTLNTDMEPAACRGGGHLCLGYKILKDYCFYWQM